MTAIGSGSFGCVISPAKVFPSSQIVTYDNADRFITKVGFNLWDEYDLGVFIRDKLQEAGIRPYEIGIFPVDLIECGVTLRDLNFDASIFEKCSQVNEGYLKTKLKMPQQMTMTRRKTFQDLQKDVLLREAKVRGGYSPLWQGYRSTICAVQYPKFDYDLQVMQTRAWPLEELMDEHYKLWLATQMFNSLMTKLTILHRTGFVHADIKLPNLAWRGPLSNGGAFFPTNVSFADFGLSVYIKDADGLEQAFSRMHDDNFWNQQRKLGPPKVDEGIRWRDLYRVGKTNEGRHASLRLIDWICLVGCMHQFFRGAPLEHKSFLQIQTKAINDEIEALVRTDS